MANGASVLPGFTFCVRLLQVVGEGTGSLLLYHIYDHFVPAVNCTLYE